MNHFLMGLKIELKSALQMPRSSSEAKKADTPLLNEQGMQQIHKPKREMQVCVSNGHSRQTLHNRNV